MTRPTVLLALLLLAAFGIAWQWWPRREPSSQPEPPAPWPGHPTGATGNSTTPVWGTFRDPYCDSLQERGAP